MKPLDSQSQAAPKKSFKDINHSWLASHHVKRVVATRLGDISSQYYRLFYNLFAVISFIPVLVMTAILPDQVLYNSFLRKNSSQHEQYKQRTPMFFPWMPFGLIFRACRIR